ncbi:MAG: hypothetical protein WD016_11540 [Balneolaceae bacterium]
MNKADILANAVTVEEHSLSKLQHWLQYGKHTWSLGAGIIWVPASLILTALKVIVFVFTPYMLWHLLKAMWYKSVVVLLTAVVLPLVVSLFIQIENEILNFLFIFLPFLNFFLYTYLISYIIGEHLIKIKTSKKWERESRKKQYN